MQAGIAKVDQSIEVAIGTYPDAASAATVSAIRSALGNEFFAAKRGAAVPALAGRDLDPCFVDELQRITKEKALPRTAGLLINRMPPSDCSGSGDDIHDAPILRAADLKLDRTVGRRVQSVIAAHSYVVARVKLGPTLPHDNCASRDALPAENLDAQSLGLGVATVAG
jgi:hypothetical protein